ncbi:MAG: alcohol dehydrogenase catalytic domain-containing protein [Fimbriimonadaceae bacterium]|nr:alcohol dehydrogenase catalytic domain-containing protein [Fimbriimonadaceae bacterium]
MKLARYQGGGVVEILDEPVPRCPEGGLLVRTEASGLCSGELMDWYMDRKVPHVLGHEVAGIVVESQDDRFPIGSRVFPHHHAPCLICDLCRRGLHVHCMQWKTTKLIPGGMAEYFAVPPANLNDTLITDQLRPEDAALIEPLACVMKSWSFGSQAKDIDSTAVAVIGMGVMGLMHALVAGRCIGLDVSPKRIAWARSIGIDAREPATLDESESFQLVFVCPGSQPAFDLALQIASPGATIVLFAPLDPQSKLQVPTEAYFRDLRIIHSYSCGPTDTIAAKAQFVAGTVRHEQVVSDLISIDQLPEAYGRMKRGEILKPMVVFSPNLA